MSIRMCGDTASRLVDIVSSRVPYGASVCLIPFFSGEQNMSSHTTASRGASASFTLCRKPSSASPVSCEGFARMAYLPHIRLRKRSWQVDERILRQHIMPTFAAFALSDITRSDVEGWLYSLARQGLAPASCNRILSVFKSLCSLAVVRGVISHSPCTGVAPLKIRQMRERYLSHDEARRLILALQKSSRPEARVLQLLLLTGARKSEILKARWEDVHLDRHLLTVPLSKSNRPRHIALSDEAVAVIRNLPRHPGCSWLFPGHTPDKPLSDIYLFWNDLRQKLGIAEVRIHDLRHTFASILVNAGHSLYEVQRLLGHSDPRTTMRYAHLGHCSMLAATGTVSTFLYGACPETLANAHVPAVSALPKLRRHQLDWPCRQCRQPKPLAAKSRLKAALPVRQWRKKARAYDRHLCESRAGRCQN